MEKSESISKLAEALVAARSNMPAILKNRTGKHNSPYADLEAVFDKTMPELNKNGLSVFQGVYNEGENRVGVETLLMHISGEWVETKVSMRTEQVPHTVGSNITYLKRYAYQAAICVVADDDDDAHIAQTAATGEVPDYSKDKPQAKQPCGCGESINFIEEEDNETDEK